MTMNDIVSKIQSLKEIAITFHASPDGDALGSALALMQGLRILGKSSYIISKDAIYEPYTFLPYSDEITGNCTTLKEHTDCMIVLDCGNIERISADVDFNNLNCTLINIDHHLSNDRYADLNYVDTKSAATAEIVYKLLKLLQVEINKNIAECLYTSLITDSGSFKYSNTTSVTHEIAGALVDLGIDFPKIHRIVFENKPFNRLKIYGKVLENMELHLNSKLCIMYIDEDLAKKLNDTSDIIALGMQVDSIEVCALLKKVDEGVKVSLRAKDEFDVRKVAEKFGGGGHSKAAGLLLKNVDMEQGKKIILDSIEKELV